MGLFDYGRKKNKVDVPNEVKTEIADDEKYVLRTAEEDEEYEEADDCDEDYDAYDDI